MGYAYLVTQILKTKTRALLYPACAILIFAVFPLFVSCATDTTGRKPPRHRVPQIITMIAVGDNLIHQELINRAESKDGSFDFSPYYDELRAVVQAADIAFVNQETLIAGARFGYSGYPRFNGPEAVGDALVETGFTVVNHATNHAMDKGEDAVLSVLDYWQTRPNVTVLGIHQTPQSRNVPKIVTVKGITVGFLSYTYGLNGLSLPQDKPYLVSLIDTEVMAQEIAALRPLCDILAVSMHWGNEYQHTPNKRQEELAAFLAAHNVDLVIGHHPHVLQPVRRFAKADGGTMLCYFSLGNFISAQSENPRLLGGMMSVTIEKNTAETGREARVTSAKLIPLITHYEEDYRGFKVYFLESYTHGMASAHGLNRKNNTVTPDYFIQLISSIFSAAADVLIPRF